MKKVLLGALLLISVGFAPCLCGKFEFPIRATDLVETLVRLPGSNLFWQVWDMVLDRVLAHSIASSADQQKNSASAVSIPRSFIRRLDGSRFAVEPGVIPRLVFNQQKES